MCAKRISKYDLTDNEKSYLIGLLNEARQIIKDYQYTDFDSSDSEIIYSRNNHDLTTAICDGLYAVYIMHMSGIKSRTTLRKGTKNYIKRYYKNGKVQQIDCYVDGKPDITYMAYYQENKRYLMPFYPDSKKPSIAYTCVTVYKNDFLTEEYMVNNSQIVYYRYDKMPDLFFRMLHINYAPEGTYPVICCELGMFRITDKLEYKTNSEYSWYSEFDAERKNIPFSDPDIPILKRIDC
ncbi:MAG: hypothetical protein IKJ04_04655 [Clostridia bacterium]|nr:hypothetical protein [Clostridia bacterium]